MYPLKEKKDLVAQFNKDTSFTISFQKSSLNQFLVEMISLSGKKKKKIETHKINVLPLNPRLHSPRF